MAPQRALLVALACAAAAAVAWTAFLCMMALEPGAPGFEYAYVILDVLGAGRGALPYPVYVYQAPAVLELRLASGVRRVPASRVFIVFRAGSAPRVERGEGLWRVWGNVTHAGVVSWVEAVDLGDRVVVRYARALAPGWVRGLRVAGEEIELVAVSEEGAVSFEGTVVARWRGLRRVVVVAVVVSGP